MSTPAITTATAAAPTPGPLRRLAGRLFGDDGLSFRDVLDLVNPLQHIPVVGDVYRELTGDTLAPGIRVAGGALFGGPIGAALSLAGLVVDGARDAMATGVPAAVDRAVVDAAPAPRGGWLLAAVSTPPAPSRPAVTSPSTPGVADAQQDALTAPAPAATEAQSLRVLEAARERRGGWLLAQAYARPDAVEAGRRVTDRV